MTTINKTPTRGYASISTNDGRYRIWIWCIMRHGRCIRIPAKVLSSASRCLCSIWFIMMRSWFRGPPAGYAEIGDMTNPAFRIFPVC